MNSTGKSIGRISARFDPAQTEARREFLGAYARLVEQIGAVHRVALGIPMFAALVLTSDRATTLTLGAYSARVRASEAGEEPLCVVLLFSRPDATRHEPWKLVQAREDADLWVYDDLRLDAPTLAERMLNYVTSMG